MVWNRLQKHRLLLFLIYLEHAMTHPEIICCGKKHCSFSLSLSLSNVAVNITLMYVIAATIFI